MRDWNLTSVAATHGGGGLLVHLVFFGGFGFLVVLIHSLPILIRCLIAETVPHVQFLGLSPDFHKSLGSKGHQFFFTSVDAAFTYRFSSGKNLQCHCKLSILLPILACMYSCSLWRYARPSRKKLWDKSWDRILNTQHPQTSSDEWVWLILKTILVELSWVCLCLLLIWPKLDYLTFSLNYIEQDLVGMSLNLMVSYCIDSFDLRLK